MLRLLQLAFMHTVLVAEFLMATYLPTSQAQVAQTGRWQNLYYSQHEVNQLAESHYHDWLKEAAELGVLNQDRQGLQHLRALTHHLILTAANWKPAILDWDWELHTAQQSHLDALCMAGGKLLINPDFIQRLNLTTAETSVLLAHEIAHALAEHHREELSEARELNQAPGEDVDLIWERLRSDLSWQIKLNTLNFIQEQEADHLGIQLALESGISAHAVISFYRKLAAAEPQHKAVQASFRDYHPAGPSRVSMALGMGRLWQSQHFSIAKLNRQNSQILAQQLGVDKQIDGMLSLNSASAKSKP